MSLQYRGLNPNTPNHGGQEFQVPKANQACMSCRKQKRKCNKALPACSLCERMQRICDYSDNPPTPTNDDFDALRMKVMQLEATLNGRNALMGQPSPYAAPSPATMAPPDGLGHQVPVYSSPHDIPWQGVQNRFPAIAFLDSETFKYGGIAVPTPSVEIPGDVIQILRDGTEIQEIITTYFNSVHKWMPIVSQKRLTQNLANPLWEAGPDLALLFLCMKLIISRPQDGIECSHNPIYTSAKRFVALMEATGTTSLLVLQANLLVTWFEYGQAIYPAASMSAGWCIRYGNMLGINGNNEAAQLLGQPGSWAEQEERRRTWWGVLLADRIVSIGSQSYIINSQEPLANDPLPAHDYAWEIGEMSASIVRTVNTPISESVAPFPRLCQASIMMGRVLAHLYSSSHLEEKLRLLHASNLHADISNLIRIITDESAGTKDYLGLCAPLALAYSTLCLLCDKYSCQTSSTSVPITSSEGAAMQTQAVETLRSVSASIVEFAQQLDGATPETADLDMVSPIIMDALYSSAANYAWMVRESGDEGCQMALDSMRDSLRRLGIRWRCAAEYLRILEGKEFMYAVGTAAS
ncbi:hypothetical protein LZ554_008385 [Drepanopeziza brunnea f. sp. 'monogermtubi']|nr:hypothetical protein LZ554_008385 [Drepanopeziza brunnea f. sp. 'monogermtubi']